MDQHSVTGWTSTETGNYSRPGVSNNTRREAWGGEGARDNQRAEFEARSSNYQHLVRTNIINRKHTCQTVISGTAV